MCSQILITEPRVYEVIVNEGVARVNYSFIEIENE